MKEGKQLGIVVLGPFSFAAPKVSLPFSKLSAREAARDQAASRMIICAGFKGIVVWKSKMRRTRFLGRGDRIVRLGVKGQLRESFRQKLIR